MLFRHSYILFVFLFLFGCGGDKSTPQGEELFSAYTCVACHSLEGEEMYGPALNEIYGKEVLVIRQGDSSKVVIDRKYLKRSIIDPDFEKLKGYENRSMPVPDISKKEVKILVDYLMELPEE